MNPILLARHVQDSLRELVHTTLNSSGPAFAGMVDRFLSEPANFIKGPWISVDMPFRQVEGAADGTWTQPFPDVPLKFAPYQHQMDAFSRLGGAEQRSTLVATGTGSGKTESYLWPILEHCRQNKDKPGIKAILIYPMNALATDQARRLASAISSIPGLNGVRAGIYADAEPQSPAHEVTPDSIITHRASMRRHPPDILLTNYKMLDYLLLRGMDKTLWERNGPETLKFLVVDEMHTFDGAQGADLALLIRRLKYRLMTPESHLTCIGSSATLGSGEDAKVDLRKYAGTIFGEVFDETSVVTETRKLPNEVFGEAEYLDRPEPEDIHRSLEEATELNQSDAARRLASCLFPDVAAPDLSFIQTGDPSSASWRIKLGDVLREHHLCQRTLKIIAEHSGPASMDIIAEGLSQVRVLREWDSQDHRALAELIVALVSWARSGAVDNPRPLFNVRLQIWIREMSRMVTNLPRLEESGSRSPIYLFHGLDLDRHALKRALPVVNCNGCGATAHIGRLNAGSTSFWAPLEQLYDEFFDDNGGDRIRLFFHDSIDRRVLASGGGGQIVQGLLDSESVEFKSVDHKDAEPGSASPVWMYNPTNDQGRLDRTCPACGQERGLLLFGMRAARLTSGITGTLYSSEQNEEDPEAKPRFLLFSDSVQDAAHRAAVAETRNAFSVYQKSLFNALEASDEQKLSLKHIIEDLPSEYMDQMGADDFTAVFISKEQTWRKRYQELIKHDLSITDPVFLDHMRIRLGWEYFVDLSYRAHFSHTLEVNGLVSAEVPLEVLEESAGRLANQLRNEFSGIREVSTRDLTLFLRGMVQRMRRQGSVAHPYVAHAVESSTGGRGPNWFAAAQQLGLRRTGTLPAPNHRRGLAPIPLSLNAAPDGFERITRNHATNWYRDWLFRVLSKVDLRVGTEPDEVFRIVLNRLEADGIIRRFNSHSVENRHAWLLEPQATIVGISTHQLECVVCGRRETTSSENAEYLRGAPCPRIGCEGVLADYSPAPRNALQRALRSDRNHRVVAREHTGILETDERLRVETGFINGEHRWSPNLISATPTLEMGIDIGDLSTLLLSSVPPEEANYVQRMGRSGRRDGNALNLVLANSKSHDLQFWEDPSPMLSGQVRPPGVFLEAEEVLLRQVTAFSLDAFVAANSAETGDYGKVREALKRRASGLLEGFPFQWLEFVKQQAPGLADTFISGLPVEVRNREDLCERIRSFLKDSDPNSIGWRVLAAIDNAATERARLVEKRNETNKAMDRLRRRRAELTDDEFQKQEDDIARDRKAINRIIISSIDDVSIIKFLTDKGILPNYAFPEEGIKLTSILSRRNDTAADEDGLLYLEYSRPASSALSEFAPGQYFYANGRQVQIERVEIGKDDLKTWTFCPSCSHLADQITSSESKVCPSCGDEMWSDTGAKHDVIELKSVISVDSEEKAVIRDLDQRDQRQFDRILIPSHQPEQISTSWFTSQDSGTPFGFEFIPQCRFRDFNFGTAATVPGPRIAGENRASRPFRVCRHCGTVQSRPRDEGDRGTHSSNCRVARNQELARTDWETDVFLMRQFETEAIRIVIPVVGDADHDDLKSFVAGINLGMRRHFAGKVDHIRSTVFEAKLDGMATVRSLYLYDAVPGGSGYLRQLAEHPNTMKSVITQAVTFLRDCACNHDPDRDGCFRCVKSYRNQFGLGEPSRDRARDLMESILRKWEGLTRTEAGIDDSIRDALLESALERRFMRAIADRYGEAALQPQVLSGGRRGFILRAGSKAAPQLWSIEPQVQIDFRFRGLPRKRVDFLFTPVGSSSGLPIIIEMDGIEFHAETVAQDILDRMLMIRSGRVAVWSLSWWDLDGDAATFTNPIAEPALSPEKVGQLGRVLAVPQFAAYSENVSSIQVENSLDRLWRRLDGNWSKDEAARSILARALVGQGRPLFELPGNTNISEEGREFLLTPELSDHVSSDAMDLYISCDKLSLDAWTNTEDDIRILLRSELPPAGQDPASKAIFSNAWRGLWRLMNLFQPMKGLHVELKGLDTLSPPECRSDIQGEDNESAAWAEVRSLTDDAFHPLIDALIAANVSSPDHIGDDIIINGRVAGTMEFGWSQRRICVIDKVLTGSDWQLIAFDPDEQTVSEAIAQILGALGE